MQDITSPSPVKPGYTTTEFWVTGITVVVSAVIAFLGIYHVKVVPDTTNLQPIISAIAMLAAAVASGWYAHSRSKVKASIVTAAPAVVPAAITTPPVAPIPTTATVSTATPTVVSPTVPPSPPGVTPTP